MTKRAWCIVGAVGAAALVLGAWGCSSTKGPSGFDNNGSSSSGGGSGGGGSGGSSGGGSGVTDGGPGYTGFGDAGYTPPPQEAGIGCTNLQCQVQPCPNGGSTTISGTVKDPAGHNPLYNVVAFIPNTQGGTLPLIPLGVNADSCSCGALFAGEEPMADALTGPDGTFKIANAPVGTTSTCRRA